MSTFEDNTTKDHQEIPAGKPHPPKPGHKHRTRRLAAFGVSAIVILALGAAGGAAAMKLTRPSLELAPMTPVAISSVQDSGLVTVKGKVAEIFGNKFIVQDDSGRALIETGPSGDGGQLVALNEPVSVQGRFERGILHASYIVHADSSIKALGPAGKPPHHRPLEDALRQGRP